jgi:hypothetical protein
MPSESQEHDQDSGAGQEPDAVRVAPSDGVGSDSFQLDAELGTRGLTRQKLNGWAAIYGTGPRQLRRWWKEGAPLDDPRSMPAWWERKHTWAVPERILAAASNAVNEGAPAGVVGVELKKSTGEAPPASHSIQPAVSVNAGPAAGPKIAPINIEDFDPDEGDRLRELKQIQRAKFEELRKSLLEGRDAAMLETKYLKLCETVDKMESRISERLKKKGHYVLKAAIARDLATAADLLRQMGESEARRIIELCPALDPVQREAVKAAVRSLAEARCRVFRNLASLKSVNDVDHLIAA